MVTVNKHSFVMNVSIGGGPREEDFHWTFAAVIVEMKGNIKHSKAVTAKPLSVF